MYLPPVLLLITILVMSLISCSSVLADNNLYSTGFSDITGWETNSPNGFYLDEQTGRYHYLIQGGTGSYAAYPLGQKYTGPFTLEFDVYPVNTEEKSSFRFGLGTDSLDSQKGPLVLAELNNQNGDNAFSLVAITKENLRSQTYSIPGKANYSGKTVRFSDGEEYHIKLTWYPVEKRVSMTVKKPGEETPIFSHFVTVSGKIEELTHLFLTSTGEGQNGIKAEGFIDNISLTALTSILSTTNPTITPTEGTPVPTLVIERPEEETEDISTEVTIPVRTPLPEPPKPTPTRQSGLIPFAGLMSVFLAAILIRKK